MGMTDFPFLSPLLAQGFEWARMPTLSFGPGKLRKLPGLIRPWGRRVLIVRGQHSLVASGHWAKIQEHLDQEGLDWQDVVIDGEPSTQMVDAVCRRLRGTGIQVVVGIGGGSVVDAAKAISAMLPHHHSVLEHLEDVGTGRPHDGVKIPYIAIPTTSGTGGEMTKNAVLSEVGPKGYKKSLRHDALIPDAVILDPELMLSCPPSVTAACGMDAFTQLLEPYLAPKASPMVEALALSGMQALVPNLKRACGEGARDVGVRGAVAYGAMLSGVCLANAGLGVVHGLASPLGGFFPIPHGTVCGTLVAEATDLNWRALRAGRGDARALEKLTQVARLFGANPADPAQAQIECLIQALRDWTRELQLPKLSPFGVQAADFPRIVAGASNRQNPVTLTDAELIELLARRL
jgi:alcohol dehydrogenase